MEFLKNLFTNDNSIIGLCGFEEKDDVASNLDKIFVNCNYAPPVNLMYKNREHLKNIFSLS